jgi:hypothetical protein
VRVPDSEGRGNTNRHSDLFYRTICFLQNPVCTMIIEFQGLLQTFAPILVPCKDLSSYPEVLETQWDLLFGVDRYIILTHKGVNAVYVL